MRPLLSIVVLNFNRVKETAFTIEHLIYLKSLKPDIEIIAVDNASSDETWEYLEKKTDHVKIMRMPSNIGIEAINRACVKALGEYVLVLDDDSALFLAYCRNRTHTFCRIDSVEAFTDERTNKSGPTAHS